MVTVEVGPLAPTCMATWPAAALKTVLGKTAGLPWAGQPPHRQQEVLDAAHRAQSGAQDDPGVLVGPEAGVGEGGAAGGDGELGEAVHAAPVAGADVGGGVENDEGHAQAVLVGAQPPPLPPGLPQRLKSCAGGGEGGTPVMTTFSAAGGAGTVKRRPEGQPKATQAFAPAKAKLLDRAAFMASSRPVSGTASRPHLGSVPVKLAVGGAICSTRALTVTMASTAPAAPSRWPIIDLELLRAVFWAASPNAARTALDSAE